MDLSQSSCEDSENVVRLCIARQESPFKSQLQVALRNLRKAGLHIDCFDLDERTDSPSGTSETTVSKPLSCPATVLCNDIELMMSRLGYAANRGDIYKKCERARYSYSYLCTMKTFLHSLMGNETFKDRLVQHMSRVLPLLSDPDSRVIQQLKISRDIVEVNNGWCWSFKERRFLQGAIQEHEIGKSSPRAFVPYDHEGEPDPQYFAGILANSLSEAEVGRFCEDFVALFQPKDHKRPVPCLIGAANSGKTSLFAPVFQIIPLKRIARVTKQKAFNKAMIDADTEVIFLDEAYGSMLDPDDWKLLCQGGYTSHDAKWKGAQAFINRASMFITTQVELDFEPQHREAMDKRLHKYHFKSLPSVVSGANQWLRQHAMDCIVWASRKATSTEPHHNTQQQQGTIEEDCAFGLTEEELERIRTTTLEPEPNAGGQADSKRENEAVCEEDEEAENDSDSEEFLSCSDHDRESETSDDEIDEHGRLERMLEESTSGGLRHRQLKHLLCEAKERQNSLDCLKTKTKEAQKQALIAEGLLTNAEVDELEDAAEVPAHLDQVAMQRRLERRREEREKESDRVRSEIEACFQNPWLRKKEKELVQEHREMNRSTPLSAKWQNYRSLIEVNSNKIRMFHERAGSARQLQHAIGCRRKMLLELELISPEQAHLVSRLGDLPPPAEHGDDVESGIFSSPASGPLIDKPLEDYSDPAAWGGIRVEKNKTNSQADADGRGRRAKKTKICSQASGQKSLHDFFKKS